MSSKNAQRKQTDRFAFTERRLAALNRPTLGAVYIYDTVTKGPCVRLTPTKAMYVFYIWYAGYGTQAGHSV